MVDQVFVGREQELGILENFLVKALKGEGQVCLISGQAGTGKTTLMNEFTRRSQELSKELIVGFGNCNSQTGIGDPFLPFREVLGTLTGSGEAKHNSVKGSNTQGSRLKPFFSLSASILIEVAPNLIGTFVPGAALAATLGKEVAKKAGLTARLDDIYKRRKLENEAGWSALNQSQIFEQYANYVRKLSGQSPLMIVLDDLHWADAASISLLFHLSRRISDVRVLIVGTYRPVEVTLSQGGVEHPLEGVLTELKRYNGDLVIDLEALDDARERAFIDGLVDSEANLLGDTFRETLLRQTDANPLFTLELLHDMKEGGALVRDEEGRWVEGPNLDWDKMPIRVEGVIERRFERLSQELRSLLNVGSVEGVQFTSEVLARTQHAGEREVVRRLSADLDRQHRIIDAIGVKMIGSQRLSSYQFDYHLFQRFLYNRLDPVERSYLHEDVGTSLEEFYGDRAEEIAVQLAWHFRMAAIDSKAVHYLFAAGLNAIKLSSHPEAVEHFSLALGLLEKLPADAERDRVEMRIQTSLGQALIATRGYAATEVKQAFGRAEALCHLLGDTTQLFPVVWGLWTYFVVRGEYSEARGRGEQLLELALKAEDSSLLMPANFALGNTSFMQGEILTALEHFKQVLDLYNQEKHHSLVLMYGQDLAVSALSWRAAGEWLLGYPDRAHKTSEQAQALAVELAHPFSLAYALYCSTWLNQMRRNSEGLLQTASRLLPMAQEQGFPFWLSYGLMQATWAYADLGDQAQASETFRQGMEIFHQIGAGIGEPYFMSIRADGLALLGELEQAEALLADALRVMTESNERWWEAELYRLQGEFLLKRSPDSAGEAEAYFQHALDTAHGREEHSLELRAAISLCQLWQAHGKTNEARRLLEEQLSWFEEGSDSPDHITARSFVAELAEAVN